MSKKGGYKIVSLGGLDLTGENLALSGLYDALKISYGKPILLTGIIIDGEQKKDALCQADVSATKVIIKHIYGYNLEIAKSGDAITVTEDSEGIELPIPDPEDDGKIVSVNVQGKYVLKPNPLGETTQADNEKVLEVINGSWGIGGKKVKVLNPPSSSLLTDDEIEEFKQGAFINGTFLGLVNPIFFPCVVRTGYTDLYGLYIAKHSDDANFYICGYKIVDKTISLTQNSYFEIDVKYPKAVVRSDEVQLTGNNSLKINGKSFPAYPNDNVNTYTLKLVAGVLTWVQDA